MIYVAICEALMLRKLFFVFWLDKPFFSEMLAFSHLSRHNVSALLELPSFFWIIHKIIVTFLRYSRLIDVSDVILVQLMRLFLVYRAGSAALGVLCELVSLKSVEIYEY